MRVKPKLCHEILETLKSPSSHHQSQNLSILQVYTDCLSHNLSNIKKSLLKSPCQEATVDSFKTFCSVLALFDPEPNLIAVQTNMRKILRDVCEVLEHDPSSPVRRMLYSSVQGKTSPWILEMYLDLAYKVHWNQQCGGDDKDMVEELEEEEDVTDMEQWLQAFSEQSNRQLAWRDMYLVCLKRNKHFLDLIMVGGGDFKKRF